MKKIIKILLILMLFIPLNKVKALETSFTDEFPGFAINTTAELNKIGITGNELLGSEAGNTYFKIASQIVDTTSPYVEDKILYCADGAKGSPTYDGVLSSVPFKECYIRKGNTSNDKSIAFVYENGYGEYKTNYSETEYLTGNWKKDYYITQTAIWYFTKPDTWMDKFNFNEGTYNGQKNDIITKIIKLIKDAEAASKGSSLQIETENNKLQLSEDNKYYITKQIKLSGNYINSKISAVLEGNDSAFITTDKDATSGTTTFENNSLVYIKIPVNEDLDNKEISLTISATSSIDSSEAIECKHQRVEEYQPIIIFYPNNKNLIDTISFSNNYYTVNIIKTDLKNNILKGATLTIKNSSGTEMETWISDDQAKSIELKPGKYQIEEKNAPEGYEVSDKIIEFVVNSDGNVLIDGIIKENNNIYFQNTPKPIQVPTGNTLIIIAGTACLISMTSLVLFILKKKKI